MLYEAASVTNVHSMSFIVYAALYLPVHHLHKHDAKHLLHQQQTYRLHSLSPLHALQSETMYFKYISLSVRQAAYMCSELCGRYHNISPMSMSSLHYLHRYYHQY